LKMTQSADDALEAVRDWILGHPKRSKGGLDLNETFARAIRQAIDEVIDGPRTGRYRYEELEAQEKTYIGTRIEIVVRTEFDLEPTGKLDTVIEGHPVDFKWSARGAWMIPREAVGELCLVLCGDEVGGTFSVGLVRCTEERLNQGANQDKKRTLSKNGRREISWLVENGVLPASFLSTLDPETRNAILAQPAGQARVREFFSRVTRQPVPREVIPTLAVQQDPMRRIRRDQSGNSLGGMKVLSGHYRESRDAAELLGYGPLAKRDYLSVPIAELESLPPEIQEGLHLNTE
jgi:plasmid stabilization system protein ParE